MINNIPIWGIIPSALTDDSDSDYTIDNPNNISAGGLAVLNIAGAIDKDVVDAVTSNLTDLMLDPTVGCILLVFNSPGGEMTGVPELADLIGQCTTVKPIYSFTDTVCASAAYYLAVCTNGIFVTPSSKVGSIGMFVATENHTQELKNNGISMKFFSRGKYKLIGCPFKDMTDEEAAIIDDRVEQAYTDFIQIVCDNRGIIDPDTLDSALLYYGTDAVANNLADQVVDSFSACVSEIES